MRVSTIVFCLCLLLIGCSGEPGRRHDIGYVHFEAGTAQLSVIGPQGQVRRLPLKYDQISQPAWSPAGGRIAYMTSGFNACLCLYVANADGSEATAIAVSSREFGLGPSQLSWSPEGREVVVAAVEQTGQSRFEGGIYSIDIFSGVRRTIMQGPATFSSPSFSPDGKNLLFAARYENDRAPEVFVADADGTNMRRLSAGEYFNRDPAWSPDGERVAYAAESTAEDDGGNPKEALHIVVVDADGSNLKRISEAGWHASSPRWSPDGKLLLFMQTPSGPLDNFITWRIVTMRPDGSDRVVVLSGKTGDNVSPNGSYGDDFPHFATWLP